MVNSSQSFCLIIAAKTRPTNTKAINMAPSTDCDNMKAGSELSVAVEGRPPKYAAKKMPAKIAPMAWAVNKKMFACFSVNFKYRPSYVC